MRLLAVGAAFLAVASCAPGASISLKLDPGAVDLVPGGTVTVDVTLTRGGAATAAVTLSAAASPGLTFGFSPSVLDAGTSTSTLTITAAANADETVRQVVLTATGAGLSATAQLSIDVQLLTVTGIVIGTFGEPLSGTTLYIAGRPATTSAGDGTFTVTDVSVPYDLTVAFGTVAANTYLGLTSPTPTLRPYIALAQEPALPRAAVSGSLTGAFSPVPADHVAVICPEGLSGAVMALNGCTFLSSSTTNYTLDLVWPSGSDAQVRLRAYLYQTDAGGAVIGIAATGTVTIDVTDGGAHLLDIGLVAASPALADLEFTVTAPAGYDVGSQVISSLATGRSFMGPFSTVTTSPTQVIAPQLAAATYTVLLTGSSAANNTSGAWKTGLTSGSSFNLDLAVGPMLVSPAPGATGVDENTNFVATNPVGGSLHFVFSGYDPADPLLIVSTTSTTIKLPDLGPIGFELAAGKDYIYQLLGTPQTVGADGMVEGEGYLGPYLELVLASRGGLAPSADGSIFIGSGGTITID